MCNWCFLREGLTGTSSVCEKENNTAKLFGVYRSVRLRVKPFVSPMETARYIGEGLPLPPLLFGKEMIYTLGAWSQYATQFVAIRDAR
jgi:hypothetical protein